MTVAQMSREDAFGLPTWLNVGLLVGGAAFLAWRFWTRRRK